MNTQTFADFSLQNRNVVLIKGFTTENEIRPMFFPVSEIEWEDMGKILNHVGQVVEHKPPLKQWTWTISEDTSPVEIMGIKYKDIEFWSLEDGEIQEVLKMMGSFLA